MFEDIRDPKDRVRKVCEYGCQVEVDESVPPKLYFRSGQQMLRMAAAYHEEGNMESAFILYSKYVTLFVEKLPKHPDYKNAPPTDKAKSKKGVISVLPLAEKVKNLLTTKYTAEEEKRQEIERLEEEALAKKLEQQRLEEEAREAELEKQREEEAQRRLEERERSLIEQEEKLRNLKDEERNKLNAQLRAEEEAAIAAAIAASKSIQESTPDTIPLQDGVPVVPPPAYGEVFKPVVPSRGLKPTPSAPTQPPTGMPGVDRATKPVDHFTSIGAQTTNKYGHRDVHVPSELMVKFLNLAQSNTSRGVETGGMICGKLSLNAFRITHLVIPKQSGQPDAFTTEQEEELFDVQDKYDLLTLGWIHTHPTQTAFLSSVDLHMHCSYQLMLPEAIAIVVSPKFQETGIFQLTPNHGMPFISSCRKSGFHPHPKEPPLFEECAHAKLDPSSKVTVIDLRK